MEDVKDTLYKVEKWAQAYGILKEWADDGPCKNSECEKCGFNKFCTNACNLIEE